MTGIIEIKDKDTEGGLAAELTQVLDLLAQEGPKLLWAILDLEATGDLGEGRSMLNLENRIQQSPEGLSVSWDELASLARAFSQIINTVIVGYKDSNYHPMLSSEHSMKELYKSCEIVLELIDGSLWSIYARKEEIIQRFKRSFHDVKIIAWENIQ